jgi:hypothetical protein
MLSVAIKPFKESVLILILSVVMLNISVKPIVVVVLIVANRCMMLTVVNIGLLYLLPLLRVSFC